MRQSDTERVPLRYDGDPAPHVSLRIQRSFYLSEEILRDQAIRINGYYDVITRFPHPRISDGRKISSVFDNRFRAMFFSDPPGPIGTSVEYNDDLDFGVMEPRSPFNGVQAFRKKPLLVMRGNDNGVFHYSTIACTERM